MAYFKIKHMSHGSGVAPVVGIDRFPISGTKHINVGFKPAYLIVTKTATSTQNTMMIYSKDYATDRFRDADASHYARDLSFGGSDGSRLFSIDDSGFTINKHSSAQEFQYIAIPENYGGNVAIGTFTYTNSRSSINLGFKPKYFALTKLASGYTANAMHVYSEDYSTSKYRYATSSGYAADQNLGSSTDARIYSIDDSGVTINKYSGSASMQYIAVG